MRQEAIKLFNAMLDVDHDAVVSEFTKPVELKMGSPLYNHKLAREAGGRRYMSRLELIGIAAGGPPLIEVCENGIIQRFE